MSGERQSDNGQTRGVIRGVLGCAITLGFAVVGIVAGGVLGWQRYNLDPPGTGSEWHAFDQSVNRVIEAGTGVIVGGIAGTILGFALSFFLLRRERSTSESQTRT